MVNNTSRIIEMLEELYDATLKNGNIISVEILDTRVEVHCKQQYFFDTAVMYDIPVKIDVGFNKIIREKEPDYSLQKHQFMIGNVMFFTICDPNKVDYPCVM